MTVRLIIPIPPNEWLTANGRQHWREKARRTKQLRSRARLVAQGAPELDRAEVLAVIRYPRNGRQDPANAAPTVKALIDGCVDTGMLPDDDAQHLPVLAFQRGPVTDYKPGWYAVELAFDAPATT